MLYLTSIDSNKKTAIFYKTPNEVVMKIHKANKRGMSDFGWLKSRHTFSFGHYFDPLIKGLLLKVINDDHVTAGSGFGTHPLIIIWKSFLMC